MALLQLLLAGLAASAIQGTAASRDDYYSDLLACPVSCSSTEDPAQWTQYTTLQRLTFCKHPVLFSVSLTGDPQKRTAQRGVMACTAVDADKDEKEIVKAAVAPPEDATTDALVARDLECPDSTRNTTSVELVALGSRSSSSSAAALIGLDEMREWLGRTRAECSDKPTVLFSYVNGTVLGYFAGARVDGAVMDSFEIMSDDIKKNGVPERLAVQHCAQDDESTITGGTTLGLVVDSDSGFVAVQKAVRAWSKAECASFDGRVSSERVDDVHLRFFPTLAGTPSPTAHALGARQNAECRWIRVEEREDCPVLARRCGIEPHKYTEYNSKSGHCSSLKAGQPVCCSSGSLPDLRPKQKANGDCFDYQIKVGDTCNGLAATYTLEEKDLFDFNNKKTWGWTGCEPLAVGKICLSSGKPPMPSAFDNAVCGPQVKDSSPPSNGKELADLNPCPLNVCCSRWGHCGTTEEFCKQGKAKTESPGTAGDDGAGCISNCGMDVVNNGTAPSKFYKLGYFEGFNFNRPCLNMDVRAVANHKEAYTDVHFSFAHIGPGPNYEVVIPEDSAKEWKKFLNITGPRKILAFGGWAFSAEHPNYHLFREATSPENGGKFARNCVSFANKHNLDGIDFDWEYPGAPDIPGIPPGGKDEPDNYLRFLQAVRVLLPSSKTLSIAAPASFWYLKQFPIRDMAPWLDYIVFMTYDLHGQWDAGNKWSSPGCDSGACLRSHVNWTETYSALAMITKAGVPARKVLMGVSSYGRSFKMAQAGCWGPSCTFVGDRLSPAAKPGRCTDERGYLANAEIFEEINNGRVTQMWTDAATKANYLVYEGTEWVSYMDNFWRRNREMEARRLNLGGTIEWAIDLQEFLPENGLENHSRDDLWKKPEPCASSSPHDTLQALADDKTIPDKCLPVYTLGILRKIGQTALDQYNQLIPTYDEHFDRFRRVAGQSAAKSADDWVVENSRTYFTCTMTYTRPCCSSCSSRGCGQPIGLGCVEDDEEPMQCGLRSYAETDPKSVSCPQSVEPEPATWGNYTFTFKDDTKKKEFYAKLSEQFGVPENRMYLATRPYKYHVPGTPNVECTALQRGCLRNRYVNIPTANYTLHDVPNPKDLLGQGYENASLTVATIGGYEILLQQGFLQDSGVDFVEALAMPALMLNESSYAMQKVIEMGKEIEKEDEKTLIINVVSAVLFVVPFVGKFASSLTVAGNMIRLGTGLIGDLGLIGLDIWRATESEDDGDKIMIGLGVALTGMGALGGIGNIKAASKIRREARLRTEKDFLNTQQKTLTENLMKKYGGSCSRYP